MQGEGLKKLQSGQPISTREQLLLIAQLSWPAILAQISSVVMQYIDTAMVGQLGSNASAAIGVVATTSWLFGDLCIALTIGFNVAVAQALGARQSPRHHEAGLSGVHGLQPCDDGHSAGHHWESASLAAGRPRHLAGCQRLLSGICSVAALHAAE